MKPVKGLCFLIGAGAFALSAIMAGAQTIPPLSDILRDSQGDVKTATEFQEGQPDPITGRTTPLFQIDHGLGNPGMFGQATALIDPATGLISDIFGTANDGGGFVLGFVSDLDNASQVQYATFLADAHAYFGNWTIMLPEVSGQVYDATPYVNHVNYPGVTASFQSDAEVPDGGLTVALLGFALVGVEGLRRKLKK